MFMANKILKLLIKNHTPNSPKFSVVSYNCFNFVK